LKNADKKSHKLFPKHLPKSLTKLMPVDKIK